MIDPSKVPHIRYTDGWKYITDGEIIYQLSERFEGIPSYEMHEGKVDGPTRTMTIYDEYPYDGASGPTVDTMDSMVPSGIHDFLYESLRQEKIGQEWRERADLEFYDLCIACGMSKIRASAWYYAVSWGAKGAARPGRERKILEAP